MSRNLYSGSFSCAITVNPCTLHLLAILPVYELESVSRSKLHGLFASTQGHIPATHCQI